MTQDWPRSRGCSRTARPSPRGSWPRIRSWPSTGVAFGPRNPELLQRVTLSLLREMGDADARYALGDVVHFPTPDGRAGYAGVVRECGPDWLLSDFNHPLAGLPVRFEVHVMGVL